MLTEINAVQSLHFEKTVNHTVYIVFCLFWAVLAVLHSKYSCSHIQVESLNKNWLKTVQSMRDTIAIIEYRRVTSHISASYIVDGRKQIFLNAVPFNKNIY